MDGSIWFSTTQSAQFYIFCSFIFKHKWYIIFWTSRKFFTKKINFMNLFENNLPLIRSVKIEFYNFIPLRNEHCPILVGQNLESLRLLSAGTRPFQDSGCNTENWMNRRKQHINPRLHPVDNFFTLHLTENIIVHKICRIWF